MTLDVHDAKYERMEGGKKVTCFLLHPLLLPLFLGWFPFFFLTTFFFLIYAFALPGIDRGVGLGRGLQDGQGVHVRAQRDARPGLAALDQSENPATGHKPGVSLRDCAGKLGGRAGMVPRERNPNVRELLADKLARLRLLVGQLRNREKKTKNETKPKEIRI
jgi:hypothetical protein